MRKLPETVPECESQLSSALLSNSHASRCALFRVIRDFQFSARIKVQPFHRLRGVVDLIKSKLVVFLVLPA